MTGRERRGSRSTEYPRYVHPSDAELGFGDEPREAAESLADLRRVAADFDNYRKRAASASARSCALASLVRELLPVVDNLERAWPPGHHGGKVVAGVEIVRRQLQRAAGGPRRGGDRRGRAALRPDVHEAIAQPSEHPGRVDRRGGGAGYRHGDRVLRPTRVVVASEPGATSAAERD